MKEKTISIRLSEPELYRLEKTAELRSQIFKSNKTNMITQESISELIRNAITRMYNETMYYFMYEDENFIISNNSG